MMWPHGRFMGAQKLMDALPELLLEYPQAGEERQKEDGTDRRGKRKR